MTTTKPITAQDAARISFEAEARLEAQHPPSLPWWENVILDVANLGKTRTAYRTISWATKSQELDERGALRILEGRGFKISWVNGMIEVSW